MVGSKYTIPRTAAAQVPEFPEDPAVQVVDLVVYVRMSGPFSDNHRTGLGQTRRGRAAVATTAMARC
ncbi:MAG: hypothetical protein R3B96_24285 [Pirellulaceae bacterium]